MSCAVSSSAVIWSVSGFSSSLAVHRTAYSSQRTSSVRSAGQRQDDASESEKQEEEEEVTDGLIVWIWFQMLISVVLIFSILFEKLLFTISEIAQTSHRTSEDVLYQIQSWLKELRNKISATFRTHQSRTSPSVREMLTALWMTWTFTGCKSFLFFMKTSIWTRK